jgi:hypothetical protein
MIWLACRTIIERNLWLGGGTPDCSRAVLQGIRKPGGRTTFCLTLGKIGLKGGREERFHTQMHAEVSLRKPTASQEQGGEKKCWIPAFDPATRPGCQNDASDGSGAGGPKRGTTPLPMQIQRAGGASASPTNTNSFARNVSARHGGRATPNHPRASHREAGVHATRVGYAIAPRVPGFGHPASSSAATVQFPAVPGRDSAIGALQAKSPQEPRV